MREEVRRNLCTFIQVGLEQGFEEAKKLLEEKRIIEFWDAMKHIESLLRLEKMVCGE